MRLEPLRAEDAAEMVGVLSAPELYEFIGGEPPSLEVLTSQYRVQAGGWSPDRSEEWLNWVVRVDGAAVGYVQASVTGGTRAAVAWVIGRPWQGRGYATAATLAMLDLLTARGVTEFEAYVAPGHTASETVAAKAGLHPTGERDDDGEQRWALSAGPSRRSATG